MWRLNNCLAKKGSNIVNIVVVVVNTNMFLFPFNRVEDEHWDLSSIASNRDPSINGAVLHLSTVTMAI